MAYRLSQAAEDQLDAILLRSARQHGIEAAARYNLLLLNALAILGNDPWTLGSTDVPRLPGVRVFPARLGRMRIEPSKRVRSPRHLIIYRVADDGMAEILGLAHDRMVLSRAARRMVRDAG